MNYSFELNQSLDNINKLEFSLFCSKFILNEAERNKVERKFKRKLLNYCKQEKIYLNYFKDVIELNTTIYKTSLNKLDKDNLAVGVYIFQRNASQKENEISRTPSINLLKKYRVYTLAHEIGHHLAITKCKNYTEKAADKCIMKLAEMLLTRDEIVRLTIPLTVYSGCDLEFDVHGTLELEYKRRQTGL